jgi:uncharacterized Zn-binding protein involved in type VI secretion
MYRQSLNPEAIESVVRSVDQYGSEMESHAKRLPSLIQSLRIPQRLREAAGSDPLPMETKWQTSNASSHLSSVRNCECEDNDEKDNRKEPKFPGSSGDAGDYVVWLTFWSKVKAKFPDKLDWPTVREQARNLLIQQGIKEIQKWLTEQSTDLLEDLLKTTSDDILDDATRDAVNELLDSKTVDWIVDKVNGVIWKSIGKGLEKGVEAGLEALFSSLGLDYKDSPGAMVAMEFSKYLAKEMVDELMKGVGSIEQLRDSFGTLQSRLTKKIHDFFNGAPLESGKATLPVAHLGNKDNMADFVITGLPTVLVCGKPIARASDILCPSGKTIVQGSAQVSAGSLPVARFTSLTAVPSTIVTSQSTVLVEGISSGMLLPDGALICKAPDISSTGNMSSNPPSSDGGPRGLQTSSKHTLSDGRILDGVNNTVTNPVTGEIQNLPENARFDPQTNSFFQLSQTTPMTPEQEAALLNEVVSPLEIEELKASGEAAFRREWSFDDGYSSSPFERATISELPGFMKAGEDGISTLGFPMKKGNYYALGGLLDLGSPEWPGAGTGSGAQWMIPDRVGIWRMSDYYVQHDATFDPSNHSLGQKLQVEWTAFLAGLSIDPVQNLLQIVYSTATTSVALGTSGNSR